MHSLLSTECYEQLGVNKVDVAGSGCDDCILIFIQKNSMITGHCFHWIFECGLHAVVLGASFGCLLMPAVFGEVQRWMHGFTHGIGAMFIGAWQFVWMPPGNE